METLQTDLRRVDYSAVVVGYLDDVTFVTTRKHLETAWSAAWAMIFLPAPTLPVKWIFAGRFSMSRPAVLRLA